LGKPLPEFTAPDLHDGDEPIRPTELLGPALLHFWASWCVGCWQDHALLLDFTAMKV
jgi:cytochrome c biogenesis protein CcmG/thiol:disulfide interchange protein DsbE